MRCVGSEVQGCNAGEDMTCRVGIEHMFVQECCLPCHHPGTRCSQNSERSSISWLLWILCVEIPVNCLVDIFISKFSRGTDASIRQLEICHGGEDAREEHNGWISEMRQLRLVKHPDRSFETVIQDPNLRCSPGKVNACKRRNTLFVLYHEKTTPPVPSSPIEYSL